MLPNKNTENKAKSGFFAPPSNIASTKPNYANLAKLIINDRFIISDVYLGSSESKNNLKFKIYKGIDTQSKKYVTIYAFPILKQQNNKHKSIKKGIKEELKEKVVPQTIWKGIQKIDNNTFNFEVHQKFGPSLAQIMKIYHKKISDKTLYVLAYQLLKLLDKIDNAGYCMRTLTPASVVLSQSATKTNLFLLNAFDLQKKGEDSFVPSSKYSSIGCSLKLKSSSKDMVESMCYILIDFYLEGKLFMDKDRTQDFFQSKSVLCPDYMPYHFLQFYNYVKNTNRSEEIKFSQWKIFFKKIIGSDLTEPYEWIKIHSELSKRRIPKNEKMNKNQSTPARFMKDSQEKNSLSGQSFISEKLESFNEIQYGQYAQEDKQNSFVEENMSDLEEYPYEDSIDEKILEFQLNANLLSDSKKYI